MKQKMIAIAAGKGGVGKSTLSVLLASSLNKQGKKVGLIDADIYGPSLRKMMREETLPIEKEGKIFPAEANGLSVMSLAYLQSKGDLNFVRAPIANGIIEHFLSSVDWQGCEYLLVDFPPGTGDIHLTLLQKARFSGVLIVLTPQEVACLDAEKTIAMFQKMEVPILGVIENMSYFLDPDSGKVHDLFGRGGAKALADSLHVPFLGEIPIDPNIRILLDKGRNYI